MTALLAQAPPAAPAELLPDPPGGPPGALPGEPSRAGGFKSALDGELARTADAEGHQQKQSHGTPSQGPVANPHGARPAVAQSAAAANGAAVEGTAPGAAGASARDGSADVAADGRRSEPSVTAEGTARALSSEGAPADATPHRTAPGHMDSNATVARGQEITDDRAATDGPLQQGGPAGAADSEGADVAQPPQVSPEASPKLPPTPPPDARVSTAGAPPPADGAANAPGPTEPGLEARRTATALGQSARAQGDPVPRTAGSGPTVHAQAPAPGDDAAAVAGEVGEARSPAPAMGSASVASASMAPARHITSPAPAARAEGQASATGPSADATRFGDVAGEGSGSSHAGSRGSSAEGTASDKGSEPVPGEDQDGSAAPVGEPAMEGGTPAGLAGAGQTQANAPSAGAPTLAYGVDLHEAIETVHATIELAARQGISQARITLEPAELGEIRIHLTQTTDGLLARVTADSSAAAQALAAGHAELRASLSSIGLSLARLHIGHSEQPTTSAQQWAGGNRQGPGRDAAFQPGRGGNGAPSSTGVSGGDEPSSAGTDVDPRPLPARSEGALVDVLA